MDDFYTGDTPYVGPGHGDSEPNVGADQGIIDTIVGSLQSAVELAHGAFDPAALQEYGVALTLALLTIALAWTGIRHVLTQAPFGELIAAAVMVLFMFGWVWLVVNPGYDFLSQFVAGFDMIAAKIAESMGVTMTDDGVPDIRTPMESIVASAIALYESSNSPSVANPSSWGPYLAESIMRMLMLLAISVAGIAYVAMFLLAMIMLQLGVLLAPIVVPFYLIAPLSFLAEGWLRFMITAGLQKVIAIAIFGATVGIMTGITDAIAEAAIENSASSVAYFIGGFIIMAILAVLMLSTPMIAAGLVSGTARAQMRMPSALTMTGAMGGAAAGSKMAAGGTARTSSAVSAVASGAAAGSRGGGGAAGAREGAANAMQAMRSGQMTSRGSTGMTRNPMHAGAQGAKAANDGKGQQSAARSHANNFTKNR